MTLQEKQRVFHHKPDKFYVVILEPFDRLTASLEGVCPLFVAPKVSVDL